MYRLLRRTAATIVALAAWPLGPAAIVANSEKPTAGKIVVYCSVDEPFARVVLDRFHAETGVEVAAVYDSEAGKTTGLVNKIYAEASRPRADVFWSGEVFNTIRLAKYGALERYDPPTAADIPERFRDPDRFWTAFAARARVLAFDPVKVPESDRPTSWAQIADPKVASRLALANPLFGTTWGHFAASFAVQGEQAARQTLIALRDARCLVVDGNSASVRAVMEGRAAFAMTDSDDVWVAQAAGASIDLVYPDLGDGGTLMIPCSVALIDGGPGDRAAARRLVDFLVSEDVERMLASSRSRNWPVREKLRRQLGMEWPAETKVTFSAVADWLVRSEQAVRESLGY